MKKIFLTHKPFFFTSFFVFLLCCNFISDAQAVRQLNIHLEFEILSSMGDNGGTVAVHQKSRNYYTTMAGRKSNPMTIFNGISEIVSPPDLALLYDIRGMWYHPAHKTFYANGYGTIGWVKYVIDGLGIPYDATVVFEGMRQPTPQSVGQYNQKENLVHFLHGSRVVAYDANTATLVPEKTILLKAGFTKKSPPPADWKIDSTAVLPDYNFTTVVYTGMSRSEFGLLNIKKREIELYDVADGLMTTRLKIPAGIPLKDKLNFAYCNNYYWLFNDVTRTWLGLR
jgi:hypothetical protein